MSINTANIGNKILELYRDIDGFSDKDVATMRDYLERNFQDYDWAQEHARKIQSHVADGILTRDEAKDLKESFDWVFDKKELTAEERTAQFAAIIGINKNALWQGQFKYLQRSVAGMRETNGDHRLRAGDPLQRTTIQGIPLDMDPGINFYPSGRLESGVLREEVIIGELSFSKGTKVEFYEDGRVFSGTLAGNQDIDGNSIPSGSHVIFGEFGNIDTLILNESAAINGYRFPKGTKLSFLSDGLLGWATLPDKPRRVKIGNKTYEGGQKIAFDESENILSGKLARQ